MLNLTALDVERMIDYPSLMAAISENFSNTCQQPVRAHYSVPVPGKEDATLLLMPAWQSGSYIGVKSATIFPSNGETALPAVMAIYLLMDGTTGEPLAVLDGRSLTAMRTAATSALAAKYLSRVESERLLVVGAGSLCAPLIRAHTQIRDYERIEIWNRTHERAERTAESLKKEGFNVSVSSDLEKSVRVSDVISCATLSTEPLIQGDWLKSGSHLDLIGAYSASRREADAQAIFQADVFVDTLEGALLEAGDLIQAAEEAEWSLADIRGTLFDLVTGAHVGRESDDKRTVFKSVGAAIEDLAAAVLIYERLMADEGRGGRDKTKPGQNG